jgi:hypothetical protein
VKDKVEVWVQVKVERSANLRPTRCLSPSSHQIPKPRSLSKYIFVPEVQVRWQDRVQGCIQLKVKVQLEITDKVHVHVKVQSKFRVKVRVNIRGKNAMQNSLPIWSPSDIPEKQHTWNPKDNFYDRLHLGSCYPAVTRKPWGYYITSGIWAKIPSRHPYSVQSTRRSFQIFCVAKTNTESILKTVGGNSKLKSNTSPSPRWCPECKLSPNPSSRARSSPNASLNEVKDKIHVRVRVKVEVQA